MNRAAVGVLLVALIAILSAVAVLSVSFQLGPAVPVPVQPAQLVAHGWVGPFPAQFWAVAGHTAVTNGLVSDPALRSFLAASPIRLMRYGAGADDCNITTDTAYAPTGGGAGRCAFNVSALQSWCTSVRPTCSSILELPGENNDSAEDAYIASWIVHTVGFHPTYWAFGNEPGAWLHYGIPWSAWSSTDNSTPTPLAYAVDVRNGISAVKAVDPGARFVGIEAAGLRDAPWLTALAEVDGPELQAYAYHLYPFPPQDLDVPPTLGQLYAELDGPTNISSTYQSAIAAIRLGCPGCAAPTVQIGEYNVGPTNSETGTYPSLASEYPGAVFMAGSIAQALSADVPVFTVFDLQSGATSFGYSMLNSNDALDPVGVLYSQVLPYFAGAAIENVSVAGATDTWSVLLATNSTSGTRLSLLVANAQVGNAVALNDTSVFGGSAFGTLVQWAPGLADPTIRSGVAIPSILTLPPQGILLVNVTLPDFTGPGRVGSAEPGLGGVAGTLPGPSLHSSPTMPGTPWEARSRIVRPTDAIRPRPGPTRFSG